MILPILEVSSIMYTILARARMNLSSSDSTCDMHEKPCSNEKAEAEMIASSKFVFPKNTLV